ncbi:short chain enoyl-CoA hydratase [Roseovarius halotolerans]|uniref:Putative enoyl-CoA hydratase echA8 n=1 Tax=Roseovarius halotolerans TaxID=505353 RepID=A0A1X6ZQA5_9RHOB|nr:enoyl-CoA hydratase-related protein [Roseovarius halotolerans]RKT27995.1 short chain enoyl-CoA hydratase [Roseovarius halotolerans]SLN58539.1 putative enoyl-CoA hydratase echA8 [Roseovarius halotolerans]
MSDLILEERRETGTVLLQLNRPDSRNALSTELRKALTDRFAALYDDPDARCVVVTGDERAFVAGADIKAMARMGTAEITRSNVRRMWQVIAQCPIPFIAAVRGVAFGGGCELAMHADIIIAGENAKFGQPEIKVGIMPGGGGTQRLPRAIGKFKAMKMMLTGDPISGREAFDMGLASECVPDADVLDRALEMADQIAAMPPLAVRRIKEVVLAGQDSSLEAGLMLERRTFDTLFDTEDKTEGMTAFIEKRKPEFKGK